MDQVRPEAAEQMPTQGSGGHASRVPPGPRSHLLLGSLPEFRRDPLNFYTRCARDYGDVARFRIASASVYLVSHPDDIESVLVTNSRSFAKGKVIQASRSFLGNGLLTSEGEFWLRQRRLMQPAFHRERVAGYAMMIDACTRQMLQRWEREGAQRRDIHADMTGLTQQIIAGALFGADVSGDVEAASTALATVWQQFIARMGMGMLIPEALPTPGNLRLRRAFRQLDEVVYRLIDRRKTEPSASNDLLAALLSDSAQERMTAQQLRDEVTTLFVAGHETTTQALSWTWYLLAQHPACEARLLEELRAVLGGRAPGYADLANLKFTEAIVLEAMRLYPPVWGIPRIAVRDCVIGGWRVPAGTSVTVSQWVVHRDPRFYPRPEAFEPQRWLDGSTAQLPRFAYFPFGGGPRMCIGAGLAMLEAVLVVATVAQAYHFTLAPGQTVVPAPSITLYPRDGIKMLLARRAHIDQP
jgi:cytochrome P450